MRGESEEIWVRSDKNNEGKGMVVEVVSFIRSIVSEGHQEKCLEKVMTD